MHFLRLTRVDRTNNLVDAEKLVVNETFTPIAIRADLVTDIIHNNSRTYYTHGCTVQGNNGLSIKVREEMRQVLNQLEDVPTPSHPTN